MSLDPGVPLGDPTTVPLLTVVPTSHIIVVKKSPGIKVASVCQLKSVGVMWLAADDADVGAT